MLPWNNADQKLYLLKRSAMTFCRNTHSKSVREANWVMPDRFEERAIETRESHRSVNASIALKRMSGCIGPLDYAGAPWKWYTWGMCIGY
jgi:hypothetical protein